MAIDRIHNYVAYLKGKPEAVRRQYALAISGGVTALIAFIWLVTLLSSGALALSPSPEARPIAEASTESFNSLVGAAAAFRSSVESGTLNVVETHSSSSLDMPEDKTQEATVIPF